MLLGPMTKGHEAELSPFLKEFNSWVAAEHPQTAETVLDTWMERDLVCMKLFEQMQNYDALLCPVASVPPRSKHGERSWNIQGREVKYLDAWSYCAWFNLLGLPAVTVPVPQSLEGLPIGVQMMGRPWKEEVVLTIAENFEEEYSWRVKPPI